MKIKAVLFDLDGTLLPMDQRGFFKEYFNLLCKKLYPLGYTDPKKLVKTIWNGVDKVCESDGEKTCGEVFWEHFISVYGKTMQEHEAILFDFYQNEYDHTKVMCGYSPKSKETVEKIKQKGLRTAVATKPIFPDIAVRKRIEWAGFEAGDFEFYTSYEKCRFCKPSENYFKEVAEKMGLLPEECLMVGNDVDDDMPAQNCGMKVFLLTDCLLNEKNKDTTKYRQGSFEELLEYIEELA